MYINVPMSQYTESFEKMMGLSELYQQYFFGTDDKSEIIKLLINLGVNPLYAHIDQGNYLREKFGILTFKEFVILGRPGSWKTTYAIRTVYDYLMDKYGGDTEAVKFALSKIVIFTMDDFIEVFQMIIENNFVPPALVLDDVSSIMSSVWNVLGQKERTSAVAMQRIVNQVKDATPVMVITETRETNVPKFMRDLAEFYVIPRQLDLFHVIFEFYKNPVLGKKKVPSAVYVWEAKFLPKEIWERLMEKRKETRQKSLESLKKLFSSGEVEEEVEED
jgi:ACT domain-containing protein